MIVFCEECGKRYDVDLDAAQGLYHSFHCQECNLLITISKERPSEIISPDVALKNQLVAVTTAPTPKKRILVVDDSKLFRRIIRDILESDGTMEVVGEASNGHEALQRNQELHPDLITLDVNMPGMGGTSALKRFMLTHPCPVVIISNLSNRSQETIIDFLRLGAVDFLVKPRHEQDPEEVRQHYLKTIHDAAKAHVEHFRLLSPPPPLENLIKKPANRVPCQRLAIIISGAGGIAELFPLLVKISSEFAGSLLVLQTMPSVLLAPLVHYMNQICRIQVVPLTSETPLLAGQCYLSTAAGFTLQKHTNGIVLTMPDSFPASPGRRQGIDPLIRSVVDHFAGTVSLNFFSGAKLCSLDTLRFFKAEHRKITIKHPLSCMLREALEEIEASGLADAVSPPESLLETIMEHLPPHG
ncbi:response regulator [Desulfobulbus rhabdoformis]|uniref:response regulator n=1 Tax=Desulfobulbus rhabdoformis TaxID=34032 RepID=UPI0019633163|nr:response regulator [Desulfobulbus rhabdoformis]MBM9614091.1 response regulator [Desulfobulbus rhabdoformis]